MSLRDLNSEIEKKFKLSLFADKDMCDIATVIVETRNLIVHHRAIVDSIFISKIPQSSRSNFGLTIGSRVTMDWQILAVWSELLNRMVQRIDETAIIKFNLDSWATQALPGLDRDSISKLGLGG